MTDTPSTRIYFDVSFPLAMPRDTLTYHLDPALEDPLPLPGCRVVAPIQKRPTIGYIVRIHKEKPGFATFPVMQVLDTWPLITDRLFEVGLWMAGQYFCSPGEAFHAMLPAGIKQAIIRLIHPSDRAAAAKEAGEALPAPILWLLDQGPVKIAVFFQAFSNLAKRLPELVKEGYVEITHERTEQTRAKIKKFLFLADQQHIPIDSLTPKEKQVVEFLLKVNTPCISADIQRQAKVSVAPVEQLLKKGILKSKEERVFREVATEAYYAGEPAPMPVLTSSQEAALEQIRASARGDRKPVLLWGVTCSGKTEVYLRWVSENVDQGKGSIVLVPEISLTPQMTKRFRERFGKKVAILHSRLSDGERFDQWEQIRRGECLVVVGARSAIFAPVRNLGTIILDEEGEPSFKQGEAPRYHAREVAVKRCELENAQLIMGSATPTMETYHQASIDAFSLIRMPQRVTNRNPPKVQVVDMRQELVAKKNRSMFSTDLYKAIQDTLAAKKQVILFLNRRGHSSFVLCRACGEAVKCGRCDVSLVYHSETSILRCHYCGEAKSIPKQCPACQSPAIKFFGAGIQRVEAETRRYFPKARIQRLDSDTVATSGSMEDILERFGKREIDIMVGTQMVAKGLDFPEVTLIGIMAADGLLRLPDFRASERNFSLLAQVSGRAGRGDTLGRVILQTYFPEHHSIRYALTEDYLGFFTEEAKHRKESGFPPYCHVAVVHLASENAEKVRAVGMALAQKIRAFSFPGKSEILGPAPSPIEKINNQYRFQILIKYENSAAVNPALKAVFAEFPTSGVKMGVDPDPYFAM